MAKGKKGSNLPEIIGVLISVVFIIFILKIYHENYPKGASVVVVDGVEYFIPSFFDEGKRYKELDDIAKNICDKYFNTSTNSSWYKGKLDGSKIDIRICSDMEGNKYDGLDGQTYVGNRIAISDYFNYNNDLDTLFCLQTGNTLPIEKVVAHELIHVYVNNYYPNEKDENTNHIGTFAVIEKDLISKGCPLVSNYIHDTTTYLKERKKKLRNQ